MNRKKVFTYIMLVILILTFSACSSETETEKEKKLTSETETNYNGKIDFVFNENLMFSKYDVDVFIDGISVDNIDHGSNKTLNIKLPKGKHEIKFEKEDENTVDETLEFEVVGDFYLKYEINSKSNKIEVIFTDLNSTPVVSKNEKEDSKEETLEEVKETDKETVKETLVETKETIKETEMKIYPKEDAKKAIITSMMNSMATDIFLEDGQTIDTSKFHPYSDTETEFAVKITSEGNWKAISEDTWRVEDIYLLNPYYDLAIKLNADITFDGEKYILSNGKKVSGNPSKIDENEDFLNVEDVKQTESSPHYEIPALLIKEDRSEEPKEEEPIISFEEAKKIFDDYGKNIYGDFKSHWIIGLMNKEYSNGKWYLKVDVTIKLNGEKIKGIADGIIDCSTNPPQVSSFNVN